MAFDRRIRGQFSELDVASESVLVQGSVQGGRVLDEGILYVQGAVTGPVRVEAGSTLHIAGVFNGELTVEHDGQAILQGVLRGTAINGGGLILDATDPGSDLRVTGDGAVLTWDELSDETKATMPRVQTTVESS